MEQLALTSPGAVLILLGIVFMAFEVIVPSFGVSAILGFVILVLGAASLHKIEQLSFVSVDWGVVWGVALFGALAIGLVSFMAAKVHRRKVTTGVESMIGHHAKVIDWQGKEGRVLIQGETWQAASDESLTLLPDEKVLITGTQNLTLKITVIK